MAELLSKYSFQLFLLLAFGFVIWTINTISDGIVIIITQKHFLKDLRGAISTGQPTWKQLVDIAELRGLSQRRAYFVTRRLLRDIQTGAELSLKDHRTLLEEYIAEYKQAEPFEGIPNETRVHLERLRKSLGSDVAVLEPLTSQIRELVSIYEQDKVKQRRYTVWGFFIGVISFIFAAYVSVYPLVSEAPKASSLSPDPISAAKGK
jgi:hypothetical protein